MFYDDVSPPCSSLCWHRLPPPPLHPPGRQDKYVVMGPGDNLGRVAKQHGTTVADIVKWNGIRDTRQIGIGTRIIVRKGEWTETTSVQGRGGRTQQGAHTVPPIPPENRSRRIGASCAELGFPILILIRTNLSRAPKGVRSGQQVGSIAR